MEFWVGVEAALEFGACINLVGGREGGGRFVGLDLHCYYAA